MVTSVFLVAALSGVNPATEKVSGQDYQPRISQWSNSSSSESHIPSAGVTLETLQSLPQPYNRWSQAGSMNQRWVYQPPVRPNYSYSYSYPSYNYATPYYYTGGYMPPGVGGRYPAIGFWYGW